MIAYSSWTLNRSMEIFDSGGVLLTSRNASEASEMLLRHLKSLQLLTENHGVPGALLFKMRPKCHYLWHTATQTRMWKINPFVFHCFAEESWLGRVKQVAVQCHGSTMVHRVLQRYLIFLGLFLESDRRRRQELGGKG